MHDLTISAIHSIRKKSMESRTKMDDIQIEVLLAKNISMMYSEIETDLVEIYSQMGLTLKSIEEREIELTDVHKTAIDSIFAVWRDFREKYFSNQTSDLTHYNDVVYRVLTSEENAIESRYKDVMGSIETSKFNLNGSTYIEKTKIKLDAKKYVKEQQHTKK